MTPWTVARQASPSMGFSGQEYKSGLPIPFPGDVPDTRIKPRSSALWVDALPSEPPGKPQGSFCRGDQKVLEIVVMVIQHCEYTYKQSGKFYSILFFTTIKQLLSL